MDYQGIDSVLVGVGGAGKTHTLAMILDEPLPDKRVSTPCTKPPVRTVTQVTIGEEGGVLERVESEQYCSIIANTAREVAYSLPRTPVARISPVPYFMRELEKKMNQCLREEDGSLVQIHRPLYKLRWNRLTDSGGQPQFLEVLPIFLHHISLGIFVIKLNVRLDAFPMIEFYNHAGNSVGTPYKSCYSQEQVIRHFMRALISQGGQRMGVKFLFIGTHRDRMEESNESVQDKNEKLKKIIKSFNMKSNVIYRGCNPIFAINAKAPDENDWKIMEQVRSELVKSANVPPISIPIRSVCVRGRGLIKRAPFLYQSKLINCFSPSGGLPWSWPCSVSSRRPSKLCCWSQNAWSWWPTSISMRPTSRLPSTTFTRSNTSTTMRVG